MIDGTPMAVVYGFSRLTTITVSVTISTVASVTAVEGTSVVAAVSSVTSVTAVSTEVAASLKFTTGSVFRVFGFLGFLLGQAHGHHRTQQKNLERIWQKNF